MSKGMGAWVLGGAALVALLWPKRANAGTGGASSGDEASRVAFVRNMLSAIDMVSPNSSAEARVLIVAQAAFESGWGTSRVAREGANPFNITRTSTDLGPVVVAGDVEYDASGNKRPITQRFAKYSGLPEAVAAYLMLITRSKFGAAYSYLESGDLDGFARSLRAGGYFTLPLDQYTKTLRDMRASVIKRLSQTSA